MQPNVCPISGESPVEELANSLTHGIGLILSVFMGILLVYSAYHYGDIWHFGACTVFAITCFLVYLSSTVYHSCTKIEKKRVYRVLDHACIYLMIAASYTPLTLGPLRGNLGWIMSAVVWTIALVGVTVKIFYTGRFQRLSTLSYLVMGWMFVLIAEPLIANFAWEGLFWMMLGGGFYTSGIIFFLWESLPFSHAIWHIFTIGGSACHYYSIYYYVIPWST